LPDIIPFLLKRKGKEKGKEKGKGREGKGRNFISEIIFYQSLCPFDKAEFDSLCIPVTAVKLLNVF